MNWLWGVHLRYRDCCVGFCTSCSFVFVSFAIFPSILLDSLIGPWLVLVPLARDQGGDYVLHTTNHTICTVYVHVHTQTHGLLLLLGGGKKRRKQSSTATMGREGGRRTYARRESRHHSVYVCLPTHTVRDAASCLLLHTHTSLRRKCRPPPHELQ